MSQRLAFDLAWSQNEHSTMPDQLDRALREDGFVQLSCPAFDWSLANTVFDEAAWFFDQDLAFKQAFAYRSAAENFGYQGFGDEALDPSSGAADRKETFTMRGLLEPAQYRAWPSETFQQAMVGFYTTCFDLAKNVMECLAAIGGLPADFFVRAHSGENVTLRLLYYPEGEATGEVVAGAHTDYGLMTLLFQDGVDGLQVESKPGYWLDVDSAVDAVVLNTGDLMAHWSNNRFPSTRHRVCRRSSKARLSIAFFCDPDAKTLVEVQPGFMADGDRVRYAKTTAGEHIQAKLLASHHAAQAAGRED